MEIYQIDAFTDTLFSGNPAAVIPLREWISQGLMQNIAKENNLSETAYIVRENENRFRIRWFTPETEVDLCGHATLAAAHVLFHHLDFDEPKILFSSNSGDLSVTKSGMVYWLDFPSNPPKPVSIPKLIPEAIGTIPIYAGFNTDLLLLVENESILEKMNPNLHILKSLDVRGVIVTAPSKDAEYDFVSRFFAPAVGIPEDPVTGSAHTVLAPFWAKKLGKNELTARQTSTRGGVLQCMLAGDRVHIGGSAKTYLTGTLSV